MPSRTAIKERKKSEGQQVFWPCAERERERERERESKAAATIRLVSHHRQTQILMMGLFDNEMGNNSFHW